MTGPSADSADISVDRKLMISLLMRLTFGKVAKVQRIPVSELIESG